MNCSAVIVALWFLSGSALFQPACAALPELSPDFGDRPAWLALDEDGKPLGEDAGVFALIVPDDKKAGRWVHAVVAITVRDEAQAAASGGA